MLFLIILFIICIRIFGWSVRVIGRLFGGLLGFMIFLMIMGGLCGTTMNLLPYIVLGIVIYKLVRRSDRNRDWTVEQNYREM